MPYGTVWNPQMKGFISLDAIKILMVIGFFLALMFAWNGFKDTVSGWFGNSKADLIAENEQLKAKIRRLETEKAIAEASEGAMRALNEIKDQAVVILEVEKEKIVTKYVKVKEDYQSEVDAANNDTTLSEEQRIKKISDASYKTLTTVLCGTAHNPCKEKQDEKPSQVSVDVSDGVCDGVCDQGVHLSALPSVPDAGNLFVILGNGNHPSAETTGNLREPTDAGAKDRSLSETGGRIGAEGWAAEQEIVRGARGPVGSEGDS